MNRAERRAAARTARHMAPDEARQRELAATVIAVMAQDAKSAGLKLSSLYTGIVLALDDPATAHLVLEAVETIVANSKRMTVDEARGYLRGVLRSAMQTESSDAPAPDAERDATPSMASAGTAMSGTGEDGA